MAPIDPSPEARDPRPLPSDEAAAVDSTGAARPAVAGAGALGGPWLAVGGAVVLGLGAFLWLSSHRPGAPHAVRDLTTPSAATTAVTAPPAPPKELDAMEAAARGVQPAAPAPPPPPPAPAIPLLASPAPAIAAPPPLVVPAAPVVDTGAQRRRAPSLVVDFGAGPAPKPGKGDAAAGKGPALNGDEQFASRISTAEPDRSRASFLRNQSATVQQGAMIPAVLETALNSDLPGFARAVVSRDVRSFDGTQVLIPRGSRVIGQYRSGVALGASRAFVIWTRVLRPDGASIQIGSSGADQLGRAGLAGKVDRHFFERFSGAVLLSVISLGQAALTSGNSTQVSIGSSSDASSIAGAASAFAPQNISPTIKVAQGTPIRIFVARDLDFSPVEPDQ